MNALTRDSIGSYVGKPRIDLTGKLFGKLTVESYSHSRNSQPWWSCRCVCGNVLAVKGYDLRIGKRTACKRACRFPVLSGVFGGIEVIRKVPTPAGRRRGSGQWWECRCLKCAAITIRPSRRIHATSSCPCVERLADNGSAFNNIVASYRKSAESRGLLFLISTEDCQRLFKLPCAYCGEPPRQIRKVNSSIYTYNGIDRIDSTIGYIPGNVAPCCKTCNLRKGKMRLSEFKEWIDRVHRCLNAPVIPVAESSN